MNFDAFESRVKARIDHYLRFAMEALEDKDCDHALQALVRAAGLIGIWEGAIIARHGFSKRAGNTAREVTRDAHRILRLIETAVAERCFGDRRRGRALHGLGGLSMAPYRRIETRKIMSAAEGTPDDLRSRIAVLFKDVERHLEGEDCVAAYYAIRDAANYIMYMTALMKLVSKSMTGTVSISDKTVEKGVMKFLAPLAAYEKQFIAKCVRGGKRSAARASEAHH